MLLDAQCCCYSKGYRKDIKKDGRSRKKEIYRNEDRVPEEPEINEYRTWINSNSIVHQLSKAERVEEWKNISGDPSKGSLAHQHLENSEVS